MAAVATKSMVKGLALPARWGAGAGAAAGGGGARWEAASVNDQRQWHQLRAGGPWQGAGSMAWLVRGADMGTLPREARDGSGTAMLSSLNGSSSQVWVRRAWGPRTEARCLPHLVCRVSRKTVKPVASGGGKVDITKQVRNDRCWKGAGGAGRSCIAGVFSRCLRRQVERGSPVSLILRHWCSAGRAWGAPGAS